MDAEPGRCRRTDGKKWRCRLAVIPDHKYCERHVHRGRLRSRKPVEVHTTILKSKSKSTTTDPISPLKATPNLQSVTNGNDGNQNKGQINNRSFKIKKNSKENAHTSLEFSFSLKSILQHNNVQHCGTSNNNHIGALAITESNRCRRTDGKKWRCSKNILPKEKYCGQHMHRGIKKVKNYEKPNTGLSLSIGSNCQQMSDDGNRSSEATTSSDSDATTISM